MSGPLATYLEDHLAGAVYAIDLLGRFMISMQTNPLVDLPLT